MLELFNTNRLTIRQLKMTDLDGFFQLQGNKKAMDMVPDKTMTREEAEKDLKIRVNNYTNDKQGFDVWAVIEKSTNSFVGTCALVYEQKNGVEIGYRFCEQFWGKGIGSEVTEGLIDYVFKNRKENLIVADVSAFNLGSIKILQNYMSKVGESFNKEDNCQDFHFELKKHV